MNEFVMIYLLSAILLSIYFLSWQRRPKKKKKDNQTINAFRKQSK